MNSELMTVGSLKQDEGRFLNELIETKGANLPARLEDVLEIFEFTDWKAKAWKTLSDKMAKLQDQQEAYHSALRSGQNWGIAALYAQKRMGEITSSYKDWGDGSPKEKALNDQGLQKDRGANYREAERIASHPDVLDRVIEDAKRTNEIPTRTAVLREIRAEKMKSQSDIEARRRREREEATAKLITTASKPVKAYMDALKLFKEGLKNYKQAVILAADFAKNQQFAPEALQFVENYHASIRRLMGEVSEAMKEIKQ